MIQAIRLIEQNLHFRCSRAYRAGAFDMWALCSRSTRKAVDVMLKPGSIVVVNKHDDKYNGSVGEIVGYLAAGSYCKVRMYDDKTVVFAQEHVEPSDILEPAPWCM